MAGMIDGFIERFEAETGPCASIVATGGFSSLIAPYCKRKLIIDSELLLKGMLIVYKKNKG